MGLHRSVSVPGGRFELIDEGEITLTQGATTSVAVGAEMDDHLLVAFGFASDPGEDQTVQEKVHWDNSLGEHTVEFEVDSASSDPAINYSVYVVSD